MDFSVTYNGFHKYHSPNVATTRNQAMKNNLLVEHLTYEAAQAEVLQEDDQSGGGSKNVFMRGIFIQGGIKNHNGRVYPVNEIRKAVESINEAIKRDNGVLGECDHPQELQIHLDRVSHKITEMWMDGGNGYGKLMILPTPCGNIIRRPVSRPIPRPSSISCARTRSRARSAIPITGATRTSSAGT